MDKSLAARFYGSQCTFIVDLLLLSPKADTHFTIPRRVEGWVDVCG